MKNRLITIEEWQKAYDNYKVDQNKNFMKNREEMMQWLRKHMDFVKTTEEFNGSEGGIWLTAEGTDVYDGIPMYDYYAENDLYELGVYTKWEEKINSMGWYSEWYDAGTVMLWED